MVFCLLITVLALAIAFFQYVQGFFSATISAILAVSAAMLALGYHESVAGMLAGKMPEEATAIALCLIFAAAYIIPRFLFDWAVPGNVRLPVTLDKVGAGVMGLIAGLFATGIFAIAAQSLPFGSSVGMFSRMDTDSSRKTTYKKENQFVDSQVYDILVPDSFGQQDLNRHENHTWLHQDELVLAMYSRLTDTGSLADSQPWGAIHPDYLLEMYGQGLGIQPGGKHVMAADPANSGVSVVGAYTQTKLAQVDGEDPGLRPRDTDFPAILVPDSGNTLLIVSVKLGSKDGEDDDSLVRFSLGSVRLVVGHGGDEGLKYNDYYPVGVLDQSGVVVAYRVDDFLLSNMSTPINLVFVVDDDTAFSDRTKLPYQLNPGAFIEFKRWGYATLPGSINIGPVLSDPIGIMLKDETVDRIKDAVTKGLVVPLAEIPVAPKPAPAPAAGEEGGARRGGAAGGGGRRGGGGGRRGGGGGGRRGGDNQGG